MKKDAEVRLLFHERKKGRTQALAAARTGMSERTARKYEHLSTLPSEIKRPRTYRTRLNPFAEDWPWIEAQLERDSALQGSTLFALLCVQHPDRYQATQVRTLQRHIATWRALHGKDQNVIFEQQHTPGEHAQSDFTHMDDLGVTLEGVPFPHLLFHLVLTYSNVEAVSVCFSESFEALAEGLERCLWQIGGVPTFHRTDHLSAAIRRFGKPGREDFTERYQALVTHYKMQPTWNNVGVAHENGDVEQAHYRFKQAVDQTLRVRGSRDFPTRVAYEHFLQDLVRQRNSTRQVRFTAEQQMLHPLPATPLAPCRELRVLVSRFSTVSVMGNAYSVPSRLIGTTIMVRVHAETLEGYVGNTPTFTLPRLVGKHQHHINYQHIIWSLVRKPGAFAAYRYRDDLFPTTIFRQAYDRLMSARPKRADHEYVQLLYLAATISESEVETALTLLMETESLPTVDAVRDLVCIPHASSIIQMQAPVLDLTSYDQLIPSRRIYGSFSTNDESTS